MNDNRFSDDVTIPPDDDPQSFGGTTMPVAPVVGALGRIDQYELVRKLGGGGYGVVYMARDTVSGVEVALKTLHPLLKTNAEEMERIKENFAVVQRLHHPNIAAALVLHPARAVAYADESVRRELRVEPGDPVLVMSYAPGVPLSKWRRQFREGRVPPEKALMLCKQIASALDFAHSERVVHRDVKPSNIMVETREDGTFRARILDFGLAAEIRSSMSRVSREAGDTSGTRPYMAPEQWTGRRQDGRTDQYALAAVFYELVSGEVPFAGVFETGDPVIMMTAVKTEAPESLAELTAATNLALVRALAKSPADRFESCTKFLEALAKSAGCGSERREPRIFVPADRQAGDVQAVDLGKGVKLELVWCPPGTFMMGSPETEPGRSADETQHAVTLTKGFWMGKYPVTQAQWVTVMGKNPSFFKEGKFLGLFGGSTRPELPVESVSWDDCQEFIRKVNAKVPGGGFRLPTEAEWEYAAKGGSKSKGFTYAGGNDIDTVAWHGGNSGTTTHPVGKKAANELGLHDMSGNVWEWCSDWYQDSYSGLPDTDPKGPGTGSRRVLRGGGWFLGASVCRSALRNGAGPSRAGNVLGFRVVLAPVP